MAKRLLGKEVNEALVASLQTRTAALREKGVVPTLGIIRLGENPSDLSYQCKSVSDHDHRELKSEDVLAIFMDCYLNVSDPIRISKMDFTQNADSVEAYVTFLRHGRKVTLHTTGNGSLDAVSNALKEYTGRTYTLKVYTEHSVQEKSSGSTAAAYIGLEDSQGTMYWGAGTDTDIIKASAHALVSAYNNMIRE